MLQNLSAPRTMQQLLFSVTAVMLAPNILYIYRLTLSSGWFCNLVLKLQIMTAVYLHSGLMCNGVKLGDTSEQAEVFPAGKCHRKSLTFREGLCARQPFRCPWESVKIPEG